MTEQPTTVTPVTPPPPAEEPRRRPAAAPVRARRSASWRPDARWRHPVEVALVCWCALFLIPLGVPALVVAALGAAGGAIGAARARARFPETEYGTALPRQLAGHALVTGAAAAGWLAKGWDLGAAAAAGWLTAGTLVLGAVYALLRSSAPKWSAHVEEVRTAAAVENARTTWDRVLADVGLKLRVVEVRETRAGLAVGVSPAGDTVVTFDTLRGRIPEITARASMLLGREGVTIGKDAVSVEETDASHVFVIHVRTKKVIEQDIPFEPLGHPATAADPVDTALYEDGREVELALVGPEGGVHGCTIGATGSGKTTTVQPIIGRYAETVDVVQVLIATDKLVPFAWPFLRPWVAGRATRPGLDGVAGQNPEDVLGMLAAVYLLVRDRNTRLPDSGQHVCTAAEPGVILWVEETADAVGKCARIEVDGRLMSFSQLVDAITRAGRSAQVSLQMLNQFALVDAFGAQGPEIFRNVTLRQVLRTMTSYDGTAMLPGLIGARADTTRLRHHSMLIQPSTEEPRVMPAKGYLFADGQIGELVEAVAAHRPEIGPAEAAVMGDAWTHRWAPERCPELVRRAEVEGLAWPGAPAPQLPEEDRVSDKPDDMDREIARFFGEEVPAPEAEPAGDPGALPSADDAAAAMEEIASRAGRVTLPEPLDAVMALLEERGAPTDFVSTRQLAVRLGRADRDADEAVLDAAAVELGRQLAEVDPALRTVQRRIEGRRARGYDVAALRQVAARIARGGR